MSESVRLELLNCPECSTSLTGEKEGVLLYCPGCGSGFRVLEAQLEKVPVYFARTTAEPKSYFPFWAFDATLQVHNVEKKKSLKSVFGSRGGLIQKFEQQPGIRLYVSAFDGDLEAPQPEALRLTLEQPQMEYIEKQPKIEGFTVSLEDAQKVADFLFLTSEIEQPDMMRDLDYSLTLTNPMVIVVGF